MKETWKGSRLPAKLLATSHPARLWRPSDDGKGEVICELCPRQCHVRRGHLGYCKVRANQEGSLVTLNYGKSVQITQDAIETEAIWHYCPGERTLSVGNIGCNLRCDFCHNWHTSQAVLTEDVDILLYSAEDLVRRALEAGIRILCWTYDDPVVWHEFVLDAARLARQHGLRNVYKSAFYISPRAVDELIDVIDVFSISLKSMSREYYRKYTGGRLPPVLDAIRQVQRSGRHLEISNLVVTGRNDTLRETDKVARWVLEQLGPGVPLHYVRFHPDHRYTGVERTSVELLHRARRSALALGLRHVYTGNLLQGEGNTTRCDCGEPLIERYGLTLTNHLRADHTCPACGGQPDIVFWDPTPADNIVPPREVQDLQTWRQVDYTWSGDITCVHVENTSSEPLCYVAIDAQGQPLGLTRRCGVPRFMVSRSRPDERGLRLYHRAASPRVLGLLDRAYYPVQGDAPGTGEAS
ncbi:MAG: AmmeMemoRadiSam system radical SAM enzyme [Pseudomonadota bacterium]